MLTNETKITAIAIALLVLGSAGVWYTGVASRSARAQQAEDTQLKRLLKERHATLKEIADQTERAYKSGVASVESVIEAEQAMFRSEFDLCETDKERVTVLGKIVASAKKLEELTSEAVKRAQSPTSGLLKAKVNRLEAEIALERVKSK